MLVSEVMNTNVISITPDDTLARVRRIFVSHKATKIPVFDDGLLVGGITELEVAKALAIRRSGIEDMKVRDVMTDNIVAVSPNDKISNIIEKVISFPLTVVMDKMDFVGIITKTDLLRRHLAAFEGTVSVGGVCTKKVKTVKPDQSIFRAVKIMTENKIKHLPVVQSGDLLGIVSAKDIALSTFGLRPEKVVYQKRTGEGTRQAVKIVAQTVGSVMNEKVETAPTRADIRKIASRMLNRGIGSIVIYEDKVRGIVTKTDLLHAMKGAIE